MRIFQRVVVLAQCAVPENINIPPQKGLEFLGGRGFCKAKNFKEMYEA